MAGHAPVLLQQIVELLQPERGGLFVDCTVGLGGHARALLQAGATRLIGIDRDREALDVARTALAPWEGLVTLVQADYRDLPRVLDGAGATTVAGVLADLGVSSVQLDGPGRGFSFRRDEPLDMRMDRGAGPTAAEWLAGVAEAELADVIFRYGEERYSRRIARALVRGRETAPIDTTGRLAAIVRRAVPPPRSYRIDPATRTFQAIRIAVNRELDGLDRFVHDALSRLAAGGRLAVVAFHSLEDRVVKHTMRAAEATRGSSVRVVTKKPIVPGEDEVTANPRARSAKLRIAERYA